MVHAGQLALRSVLKLWSNALIVNTPAANTSQGKSLRTVVLIVNHSWVAWKFRSRLMQHLRGRGYRVVLLTDCSAGCYSLPDACDELVDVPMAATRIAPVDDLGTLRRYARELARLKPVAVLTFTIKPNIYGALASHRLGVPVIANVTGLGSIKGRGGLVDGLVKLLYRWALSKDRWVYFQNPQDVAKLRALGLVPEGRWSILPGSGVDVDRYQPQLRRKEPGRLRFCMLARLLRDKGVVEFAEAARRVRRERSEVEFELWGILDAADARCVTAAEVAAWEAEGLLSFRGEARDAVQAFEAADAVVLPSYYPEGLPRTLLEAAAMELPSITTDMPGCRDAVVNGVTGLLCAPRDASALAETMLRLADMSPEARAGMGAAARERVLAQFDEKLVLDAYVQQLTEAVRPHAGARALGAYGRS
jgi:glycosyltransferase involved in cell wall biosynthesis